MLNVSRPTMRVLLKVKLFLCILIVCFHLDSIGYMQTFIIKRPWHVNKPMKCLNWEATCIKCTVILGTIAYVSCLSVLSLLWVQKNVYLRTGSNTPIVFYFQFYFNCMLASSISHYLTCFCRWTGHMYPVELAFWFLY